jgi:hypothetical protein
LKKNAIKKEKKEFDFMIRLTQSMKSGTKTFSLFLLSFGIPGHRPAASMRLSLIGRAGFYLLLPIGLLDRV